MRVFGILFLVVLLIIFLENPKFIFNIIRNIRTIKGLISKYYLCSTIFNDFFQCR